MDNWFRYYRQPKKLSVIEMASILQKQYNEYWMKVLGIIDNDYETKRRENCIKFLNKKNCNE